MDLTNETFAPLRVMIDEFIRLGVEHAVIAPGSRNAPIAYALSDREELKTWSVLDERSAGFFALGIAKSSRRPVIVTCTSGSAAANLHPAVVEASHAGIPLIVLTADRPPELRDVGAGQAIDQINLYGSAARWFVEAGNHEANESTLRHFRSLGCRAIFEATGADPGPVQINLPLREPLQPVVTDIRELESSIAAGGRPGGAPWTAAQHPQPATPDLLAPLLNAKRPLFVVGEQHVLGLAAAIADLASAVGAPVLADALSQLRRHQLTEHASIVCAYDLILRNPAARSQLKPDLVVRIGDTPTSKPLRSWLGELDASQIVLDPRGAWREPTRIASEIWQCDPLATVSAAIDRVTEAHVPSGWVNNWRLVEAATQSAIDHALHGESFPFEPSVYRNVAQGLERGATIFMSSSMPVRDVESYGGIGRDDVRYLSNRGTNGIDGVISTALGVRAPYNCDRVIVFIGDLATLYDIGALATAVRHGIPITIVCVDNDGGGIFSFLPVADHPEHFEDKIAAPSGVDLAAIVQAFGIDYVAPHDADALAAAVEKPGFVHLKTNRAENKKSHDEVVEHVLESVTAALAGTGAFH